MASELSAQKRMEECAAAFAIKGEQFMRSVIAAWLAYFLFEVTRCQRKTMVEMARVRSSERRDTCRN
jgi:hypothetical protein